MEWKPEIVYVKRNEKGIVVSLEEKQPEGHVMTEADADRLFQEIYQSNRE